MTDPAARSQNDGSQASLGDLVALAVSDITQLVKFEVDLAKLELKEDARRLGIGGVLLGVAGFVGCLVLMLLCFAFAYGLIALGIWAWAAFLIVAGTCILLAARRGRDRRAEVPRAERAAQDSQHRLRRSGLDPAGRRRPGRRIGGDQVSNGANRATGAAERGVDLPRRPVVASIGER